MADDKSVKWLRRLKFHYDSENDLFYTYRSGTRVHTTLIAGDFYFEIARSNALVSVEVLNASAAFEDFGISRKSLQGLQRVDIKVVRKSESTLFQLVLFSGDTEKSAAIAFANLDNPSIEGVASSAGL